MLQYKEIFLIKTFELVFEIAAKLFLDRFKGFVDIFFFFSSSSAFGKQRSNLVEPEAKRSRSQSPCVTDNLVLPPFNPSIPLGEKQTQIINKICLVPEIYSVIFFLRSVPFSVPYQVKSMLSLKRGIYVACAQFST